MNFSEPFIRRPVATILLSVGIVLAGLAAFSRLSVAQLPEVDLPTITVSASMPGASPETMAAVVATPLERHLGAVADVTEMTSQSTIGNTTINLQFGLSRAIDGAARDVQAAINAARADLPASLTSNPTYRKSNAGSDAIMVLYLTSPVLTPGQLFDLASTILQQKLSQIPGVGNVSVSGSSLPAVRVDLNPTALFKYGVQLEEVRAALAAANAHSPKGAVEDGANHWQIYSNDQARSVEDYQSLVIAYRNGAPLRLSDVADITDSVEDVRNVGIVDGHPAAVIQISRQPQANIVTMVNNVKAILPKLQASLPPSVELGEGVDRSISIRRSLIEVEKSLVFSVCLVVLVVFFFFRDWRSTLIPCAAVPISLIGTFGAMYLLNYTLNTLSLMALTIATGFIVDDSIVVMENIMRHIEGGGPRSEAVLRGVRQVAFTVLSMSLAIVGAFIPILFMGGVVGRLFQEFTITLFASVAISLFISLTLTPMLCARALHRAQPDATHGRLYRGLGRFFDWAHTTYEESLEWVLHHRLVVIALFLGVIGLNIFLFRAIPKGFFPDQDTGRIVAWTSADQSISFPRLEEKMRKFTAIMAAEPEIVRAVGVAGGGGRGGINGGPVFASLRPRSERKESSFQIIDRLRPKIAQVPGATVYLSAGREFQIGARQSNSTYQYTLEADNVQDLRKWTPRLVEALKTEKILTDVNSDQQDKGLESQLIIDREKASQLGLSTSTVDNTLYDAFGQRQVSTIYKSLNQYHVVMGVAPRFSQGPSNLDDIYVATSSGAAPGVSVLRGNMVPLASFTHYETGVAPLSVNHQGTSLCATISFGLKAGASLSQAVEAIDRQAVAIHLPREVHGGLRGTAKAFQDSISNEPLLVLGAMVAIYIVLGVLYESYLHPLTILSTLPSAGLGAVLSLMLFNLEFSLIALIALFLLIGVAMKNAIMMVDFASTLERTDGLTPRAAIFRACLLRFRPILMTTATAVLAALPLAIGFGEGGELRRPLGISIIGGLMVSQVLTLYTTPVIYLFVGRLRLTATSPAREPATTAVAAAGSH